MKTQTVRLIDIAWLGPVMFAASRLIPANRPVIKNTLAIGGLLTIAYNAYNYYNESKKRAETVALPVGPGVSAEISPTVAPVALPDQSSYLSPTAPR